jgi:hypothetical protein
MDPSTTPSERATTGVPASQPTWNDSFSQADSALDQLRVKLPAAPPGLLDGYMNVVPWIAIIFGILGVLISLVALVGSTALGPLMVMFGAAGTGLTLILGSLLSLVAAAIDVVGGWLMLQRRMNGWWLLAIGYVIAMLSSLFHVSVLGLIFWILLAYLHLQVKPNYR